MKYDLIVIGGGSAGHAAARTATSLGLHCALVEAPGELGGLCILRGCMPSKILIETANRMRDIREAPRFAIQTSAPVLDHAALKARLDFLLRDFREYREKDMLDGRYKLIRGTAKFTSPHEIRIDENGDTFTASAFIIATGSVPEIPDIEGLRETPFWTSDDVVRLPEIPREIVIIGSGAIGMEAAHLFEGFGSKVTLIVRGDRILGNFDPDVSEALHLESTHRGIRILTDTRLTRVRHGSGKFHLVLEGETSSLECDALLLATGRSPNTIGFGLQKIGIAMERKRILIDDRCSTSLSHIFAAGDCASPIPVVHLAVIQGEVAAKNAAARIRSDHSEESAGWHPESAMNGLFTEPQCVEIGMNESTARRNGIRTLVGKIEYNDQGKGMIAGSHHGFVKIIADASTHKIIGAAGIGPQVLETAHILQLAIFHGFTLEEYAASPHYHPSLTEAWHSAALEAELTGE